MDERTVTSEATYLLDQLVELLESGRRLPFAHQALVNQEQALTLIEQVRHALPEEMRQAQWVIRERDCIIEEAGRQSSQVMNDAQDRADALANDSEVVRKAQALAQEIVAAAEQRAQEIHLGALDYAKDVLQGLDDHIATLLATVREDQKSLSPRKPA